MRIAKFIANNGICSRREAERLIEQGVVSIDGKIIDSPAVNVCDDNVIVVNGERLKHSNPPKLWIYYKPVGLITTHQDPQGRTTIFETLDDKLPRVISVGRLDINSEGLLLLTNSGDLSRYYESPANQIERVYKVRVFGRSNEINFHNRLTKKVATEEKALGVTERRTAAYSSVREDSSTVATTRLTSEVDFLGKSNESIVIDGIRYNPKSIKLISTAATNSWYEVVLTEGKNREIRRIFEHFGFEVSRLIRTSFGPYSLGNLSEGQFREVEIVRD